MKDWQAKFEDLQREYDDLKFDRDGYKELWDEEKNEHAKLKKHIDWIRNNL